MGTLIGIAAVAIVAWFAAGTIWNVRRGSALLRWMQEGLPLLGARTTVRWLGSTAVELQVREGLGPFANATLVIFLEPRDVPWWPLSRLRGRRDTLIVRAVLRKVPQVEWEALEAGSWSEREAEPRVPAAWDARAPSAGETLRVRYPDAQALEKADQLVTRAREGGIFPRRLSVRRSEPHFQLHDALPDTGRPAGEYFETVRDLAVLAGGLPDPRS